MPCQAMEITYRSDAPAGFVTQPRALNIEPTLLPARVSELPRSRFAHSQRSRFVPVNAEQSAIAPAPINPALTYAFAFERFAFIRLTRSSIRTSAWLR